MAREHEHWTEQGEIFALGALDGGEREDFEAHLAAGCAICEAHVRETREDVECTPSRAEANKPTGRGQDSAFRSNRQR